MNIADFYLQAETEQEAEWHREASDAEARFVSLLNAGRCVRCESIHTHDTTGEYDAGVSRRCETCGHRYSTEM